MEKGIWIRWLTDNSYLIDGSCEDYSYVVYPYKQDGPVDSRLTVLAGLVGEDVDSWREPLESQTNQDECTTMDHAMEDPYLN